MNGAVRVNPLPDRDGYWGKFPLLVQVSGRGSSEILGSGTSKPAQPRPVAIPSLTFECSTFNGKGCKELFPCRLVEDNNSFQPLPIKRRTFKGETNIPFEFCPIALIFDPIFCFYVIVLLH